jgi:hypothetical protein
MRSMVEGARALMLIAEQIQPSVPTPPPPRKRAVPLPHFVGEDT